MNEDEETKPVSAIATPEEVAEARAIMTTARGQLAPEKIAEAEARIKKQSAMADFDKAITMIKLLPLGPYDRLIDALAEALRVTVH